VLRCPAQRLLAANAAVERAVAELGQERPEVALVEHLRVRARASGVLAVVVLEVAVADVREALGDLCRDGIARRVRQSSRYERVVVELDCDA
jgi:hypothetical protein